MKHESALKMSRRFQLATTSLGGVMLKVSTDCGRGLVAMGAFCGGTRWNSRGC